MRWSEAFLRDTLEPEAEFRPDGVRKEGPVEVFQKRNNTEKVAC